ncbi:MAG: hypothetical protein CMD96_01050 [Gammaproteobacteria bacterium]|jgi:hypothetical protein|nr:hypothetical protein [Gammaproteobacteria bacterium]MBQ08355.1 hypothetical protein [Gammaproteobacteria bacterium]HJL80473.1 succinylglutamate desuccinylase/aspartoacylase family protein [Gammaproteobacteria bacterium]|tara:strand:- start:547 stop:1671 length:1125 start_codon:yes stop_codon:yes gene_type:complete
MNKITTKNIPVSQMPNGDTLSIKVIDIKGDNQGPSCYIQASMHGAEHQGNALIYHILDYAESHDIQGSLRIIPQANPLAINTKTGNYTQGRFNPNTGHNWNRLYSNYTDNHPSLRTFAKNNINASDESIKNSYKKLLLELLEKEKELKSSYGKNQNKHHNLILQSLAANFDIVLDLHTAGKAARYLYAAEYLSSRCEELNFVHNIIIKNIFNGAMDEAAFMPWVNLKTEFKKLDKDYEIPFESYTLELGSEEMISLEEGKKDSHKVLEYLYKKGIIRESGFQEPLKKQYKCQTEDFKSYYAPNGGLYEYYAKPGEFIKKGESLAISLQLSNYGSKRQVIEEVKAKKDCIIINHCTSSSVIEGSEIYQVMENYYT